MERKAVTNRERILYILNFRPADRMPEIELMEWWDKTIACWSGEGLPDTTWPFLKRRVIKNSRHSEQRPLMQRAAKNLKRDTKCHSEAAKNLKRDTKCHY